MPEISVATITINPNMTAARNSGTRTAAYVVFNEAPRYKQRDFSGKSRPADADNELWPPIAAIDRITRKIISYRTRRKKGLNSGNQFTGAT